MNELLAFAHARLDADERAEQRYGQEGCDLCGHRPAPDLRDIQARRATLVRCQEEMLSGIPRLVWFAKMTAWEMAQRWNDHEAFKEEWKP